jgi:cyclopropane-fatty-acyl-phospholipid synthase
MLFARLLGGLITHGSLTLVDSRGHSRRFGHIAVDGLRPVTIRLHSAASDWRLALRPNLAVGEAYMNGDLTVENGDIYDFLALANYNLTVHADLWESRWEMRLGQLLRRWHQNNPLRRARHNVAHHYDLSGALYDLFLDADRQYSCAFFAHPGMTLEEAQAEKKRRIAAKLLLAPGQTVLDIGCGWGGLALALAAAADVEVLGITLSREQLEVARRRAADAGLADRVRFQLLDYREVEGRFDRIVSVGMFEHVGVNHFNTFFSVVRSRLADAGVALLHSIGRSDGPGATNDWIRKYIFPGGYSPALSEVLPAVERQKLFVTDVEVLRLHYADTLREWRRRFIANWQRVVQLYDERFCRMWEFYLAGSETAFRYQGHVVFQMQMAKSVDAVPLTRDYLYAPPAGPGAMDARAAAAPS